MKIVSQRQKAQAKAMLSHNAAGNSAQPVDAKNTIQGVMQKIACGAAVTLCLALTPSLVHAASPSQPEGAAGYPGIVIPDPEAPQVRRTHGVPGYPNEDLNAVAPSSPTHMVEEIPGRGAVTSPPPAGYEQPQIATPVNAMEADIALPDSTYTNPAPASNAAPAPAYSTDPSYPGIVMPDPAAPKVRRTHGVPGYPNEDLNAVAPSLPTTTLQDGPAPAVLPSSAAAQPALQPEPVAPAPEPQPYQPAPVAPTPYQPAPELEPYPVNVQPQPYPANPEPAPYPVAPQPAPGTQQPAVQPYPPSTQYAPGGGGEGDIGGNPSSNPVPVDNAQ